MTTAPPLFIALSLKVSSHLVVVSFGPKPGKCDEPTLLKLTVRFQTACYLSIRWPYGHLYQSVLGIENKV